MMHLQRKPNRAVRHQQGRRMEQHNTQCLSKLIMKMVFMTERVILYPLMSCMLLRHRLMTLCVMAQKVRTLTKQEREPSEARLFRGEVTAGLQHLGGRGHKQLAVPVKQVAQQAGFHSLAVTNKEAQVLLINHSQVIVLIRGPIQWPLLRMLMGQ